MDMSDGLTWASPACTLPTVEKPLRGAEFDRLFRDHVVAVVRRSPNVIELQLIAEAEVAAGAADLAVRETGCCSFFTFALTMSEASLVMTVSVEPPHEAVLGALADRAELLQESTARVTS